MEAVGHLTGGIAHDFNNLLTAIIGGLDLYLRRSDATGRDRRYLEGALEAAERGAKLTSRLLAFSRTQQFGIKAVDVRATLDGMSELLRQSLGPTIDIRVVVNPGAEWVSTDAGQLELALLNLAVNARDAMPNGGTVTFEAKRQNSLREGKPCACVEVSIRDTGLGMEQDVRVQSFDPFFTTKGGDKGTRLGLAKVYAFARALSGNEVERIYRSFLAPACGKNSNKISRGRWLESRARKVFAVALTVPGRGLATPLQRRAPDSSINYRPPAPESFLPRNGGIVPWATSPTQSERALAHPNPGVRGRHELTSNRITPRAQATFRCFDSSPEVIRRVRASPCITWVLRPTVQNELLSTET